jgi:hypothetical protein
LIEAEKLTLSAAIKQVPHQISGHEGSCGSLGTSPGAPETSQVQISPLAHLQPRSAGNGTPLNQNLPPSANVKIPQITTNPFLVFLTVNTNEEYRLAQIKTNGVHDDNFFEELKREYTRLRGWIRRVFSIWRYAGSDFSKVCDYTLRYLKAAVNFETLG